MILHTSENLDEGPSECYIAVKDQPQLLSIHRNTNELNHSSMHIKLLVIPGRKYFQIIHFIRN